MSSIDNAFANFVNGKRIAVVGRAEYLSTLKQGDFIDSFDLVFRIRSNVPYPGPEILFPYGDNSFIPDEYQECLGKRVDCFAGRLAYMPPVELKKLYRPLLEFGCEWLMLEKIYNAIESAQQIDYATNVLGFNFHQSPQEQFDKLSREFDYVFPLPGTLLIHDLLHYDVELYVTGFMCYQDLPSGTKTSTITTRPHHPKMDAYYLRALYNAERIQVDSQMKEMFTRLDEYDDPRGNDN